MHCTLNTRLRLREGHLLALDCNLCWEGDRRLRPHSQLLGKAHNCADGGTTTGHLNCTSSGGREVHVEVEGQQSSVRTSKKLPPSDGRKDPVLPKPVQVPAEQGVP